MKIKYLLIALLAPIGVMAQNDTKPGPEKELRTWLGVATENVHPVLRQHLDLKDGFGVQIAHVPGESPADAAGLQAGDVLSMLDDQHLTTPEHLAILIRSKSKGDSVELTYLRKGNELKTTVTLGETEMPKDGGYRPSPGMGSPDQWQDWHGEMRRHQEDFQRRMQDMHRNRMPGSRLENKPNFDRKNSSRGSRNSRRPRGSAPKPILKNESTVKIDNDQGEVVISRTNGKGRIEINDSKGNEVYSGPFDTAKGINGLPEKAQNHLKEMKVDNIDMLAPTPIPVLPKPDPETTVEEAL